ncbi:MAG: PepSY-like domain-containing protein [Lewinellaceae bacterium]|nr:PepSY-like domain-containing protein [Lewinellaceae bacterium]
MRKIIIVITALALITLSSSCEREQPHLSLDLDELIIEQITNADNLELLGSAGLPVNIRNYVQNHHAPFEIGLAFMAPGMGYEVMLENGLCLFFDMEGQHLNHNGMHDDWDNHHGWDFAGNNPCLFGDLLDPADLPQDALDHINTHYPGASVVTAVVKPSGNFGVELDDGTVLMFGPGGDFIFLWNGYNAGGQHGHGHGLNGSYTWHCEDDGHIGPGHGGHHGQVGNPLNHEGPCLGGAGIPAASLPPAVSDYMDIHYPAATVIHAVQTYSGKYFLRLSDCIRLVFDEDGNIIFDSGN